MAVKLLIRPIGNGSYEVTEDSGGGSRYKAGGHRLMFMFLASNLLIAMLLVAIPVYAYLIKNWLFFVVGEAILISLIISYEKLPVWRIRRWTAVI